MRRTGPAAAGALVLSAAIAAAAWSLAGGGRAAQAQDTQPSPDAPQRGDPAGRGADVVLAGRAEVEASIEKGVAFLVHTQNKSGSWGTPAGNLYDIYAPVPGSLMAFEAGASALALSGILDASGGDLSRFPGAAEAVARGSTWLLENHDVKRATSDVLYNTWTHSYSIEAFARLYDAEKDPAKKENWRRGMAEAVDLLRRYETVDGGWGYYDFSVGAQRPGPGATCFSTATGLVALHMAKVRGVEIPPRLAERALAVVERSRKPDNAFCYSLDHELHPTHPINKVKGSLARTQACLHALGLWKRRSTDAQAAKAIDDLETEGRFLRIARKYPRPHESWYFNSGYFCFYGYYYAAHLLPRLPAERRVSAAAHIAGVLVPLQEKDGCFWDYQLYGYHKAYGTGYVLSVLARCRDALPAK